MIPGFLPGIKRMVKAVRAWGFHQSREALVPRSTLPLVSCGLGSDFTTCLKEGGTRGQRPQLWKHCTRAHILGLRQGKSQVLSVSQVLRLQNEVHALHLGTVEFPGSETALGSPVVVGS